MSFQPKFAHPVDALNAVERPGFGESKAGQSHKNNYAETISRNLAQCFADALRSSFPQILPTPDGSQHESRARGAQGTKKLDVNASTPEHGLALGVSIKTLNFPDERSGRYTKNFTRIANELRSEAMDYHVRQPFAVMAAFVFLPMEACDDGNDRNPSSFGHAVRTYRSYSGRDSFGDSPQAFEEFFIGLYTVNEDGACTSTDFFDVRRPPPRARRPRQDELLSFEEVISRLLLSFERRNDPPFEWADD